MAITIRYGKTERKPREAHALAHAEKVRDHIGLMKQSDDYRARLNLAVQGHPTRKAQAESRPRGPKH